MNPYSRQLQTVLSGTCLDLIRTSSVGPFVKSAYIGFQSPCLVFKHQRGFVKLCLNEEYYWNYDLLYGYVEIVYGTDPTRPGRKTSMFNFENLRDRMIVQKQISNLFQTIN
jgi:hypothetical protein